MKHAFLFFLSLACLLASAHAGNSPTPVIANADLRVRDPYILADAATKTYYLYRQIANGRGDTTTGVRGVEVFTSTDLQSWTGPTPVFVEPADFWADAEVWAPEVHAYRGKYYLFVTLTANRLLPGQPAEGAAPMRPRGTQILVADAPTGPFQPFSNQAHTPADWMCLDGTLWVEDGTPWMVFCHEWHQITDGTMELVQLAPDLSTTVGTPRTLFSARSASWVKNMRDAGVAKSPGYVTDGPFVYRTKTGRLLMIWSSFGSERYGMGIAESTTGKITGPWVQQPDLLFKADGGHGMIFRTFTGQLMLCFHQPNQRPLERMRLFPLEDTGDTLRVILP
jgi:beta-xylosidase